MLNQNTRRVYIAATRQNDGKTTTSLGLFHALKKRFKNLGYIKPVGQRFVEVNGLKIDEDSVLMERTYQVQVPLEDMSPIAVEHHFTRNFLTEGNVKPLEKKLENAFNRAAWEKDFVIIEGSGHAGVGSVFQLNNARVAKLLKSKVVIITRGGIGAPVDEVALNLALFEKHNVEVIGVILNKVLPEKLEVVEEFASKAFATLGLPVLGVLPQQKVLASPTVHQIAQAIEGRFLNENSCKRSRIGRIILGAMSSGHLVEHFSQDALVITPGDREDLILAALLGVVLQPEKVSIAGLILTEKMKPSETIQKLILQANIPVILTEKDSYNVVSTIYGMTVKTEAEDEDKITAIQKLIEERVKIDELLQKV